jgi:alpha-L-fucosidase
VEDLERGVMPGINPYPWQTDTSIGDWYYNRNWKFRPVSWSIHMLVDIVSKNGNLLLNVVQRPDGSLDPEVEQALGEMANWIAIHGEAIYGTRPWQVYGEGAVKTRGGSFKEDFAYTARDLRFTTKGDTLYAFALGWPEDGRLTVRSLARPAGSRENTIRRVQLLGHRGRLAFAQDTHGLVVTLPDRRPSPYTAALKITGRDLNPVPFTEAVEPVKPDARGHFTLTAEAAELHGDQLGTETRGGQLNIAFWDRSSEWVSWVVRFPAAGAYDVTGVFAAGAGDAEIVLKAVGQSLAATVKAAQGWDDFREQSLGRLEIREGGVQTLTVQPRDAATWKALNLRALRLTPAAK